MSTTQEHLLISDIADDILLLKDGGGALVLQVSAVNFGLLSDREQIAIISAFAQMLNSLSFSIQIVIHSERLNISSYVNLLDKAQKAQTNPLLSQMMTQYKQFVQATIKENEVLDKKFYIVIPLFKLELGLTFSKETLRQKIKTVLLPRRDQVIRQLNRVGLKATQLTRQKLIELFYDIYNGEVIAKPDLQPISPQQIAVTLKSPKPVQKTQKDSENQATRTSDTLNVRSSGVPSYSESTRPTSVPITTPTARNHPFVVEELSDNI